MNPLGVDVKKLGVATTHRRSGDKASVKHQETRPTTESLETDVLSCPSTEKRGLGFIHFSRGREFYRHCQLVRLELIVPGRYLPLHLQVQCYRLRPTPFEPAARLQGRRAQAGARSDRALASPFQRRLLNGSFPLLLETCRSVQTSRNVCLRHRRATRYLAQSQAAKYREPLSTDTQSSLAPLGGAP